MITVIICFFIIFHVKTKLYKQEPLVKFMKPLFLWQLEFERISLCLAMYVTRSYIGQSYPSKPLGSR